MKTSVLKSAAFLVLFVTANSLHAEPTVQRKFLTLEGAERVMAAAMAEARRVNAPGGAIAIVDAGGHPVITVRLDNTFPAAATISLGKARTSALFRKPTKFFEDVVNKGRTTMVTLPDTLFTPLQGGIPLVVDGETVGAIGISGAASAAQDEQIAEVAAAALGNAAP